MFHDRDAEAAELFALEHRSSLFAWTLAAIVVSGNVGSVVLMLLAQG